MKNYTNIYDIDGNLIRKAGDVHKFTVEEVEKLVDELTEKVKNNPDNKVYKVYLNNANKWLYKMYGEMSKEDLAKRLFNAQDVIQKATQERSLAEQKNLNKINEAIEGLKQQYEEEYVDFEEINENEGH